VKAVDRDGLPALDRYARLLIDGEERLAGYVEASRGCAHRCKHCPVPVVYDGRVRLVDVDVVLGDVERLVAAGARHLTFGDPDFLNAPQHSRRVVAAMHAAFPDLTFDCTAKVSHLLAHADVWPEWAEAGCLFVVSAFESVDDAILRRLDKGHTAADAAAAVDVLRLSAIEIRPSFLPFTPWTHLGHLAELTDFVVDHDLAGNVDPVQYTIRLLLPPGSLLLGDDGLAPHLLSPTDGDGDLAVPWASADPAVDRLHAEVSGFVEDSLAAGNPPETTFSGVRNVAYAACGRPPPPPSRVPRRPRLSEPWFCCAEPTQGQALAVAPERLATGGRAD
jgi:hypothetical protein